MEGETTETIRHRPRVKLPEVGSVWKAARLTRQRNGAKLVTAMTTKTRTNKNPRAGIFVASRLLDPHDLLPAYFTCRSAGLSGATAEIGQALAELRIDPAPPVRPKTKNQPKPLPDPRDLMAAFYAARDAGLAAATAEVKTALWDLFRIDPEGPPQPVYQGAAIAPARGRVIIEWKPETGLPPSEISMEELEANLLGAIARAHEAAAQEARAAKTTEEPKTISTKNTDDSAGGPGPEQVHS